MVSTCALAPDVLKTYATLRYAFCFCPTVLFVTSGKPLVFTVVYLIHTQTYTPTKLVMLTRCFDMLFTFGNIHTSYGPPQRRGGVDAEGPEGKHKRNFEMIFWVTKTGVVLAELYHQCPLKLPKTIKSFSTFGFQGIHFGDSFGLWLHVPCRGHQIVGLLGSIFVEYA